MRINLKNNESRSKARACGRTRAKYRLWHPLFSDVDIDLREGEAQEFRGRNGAGKTTLIKAILGDQSVTTYSGELTIDKHARIGVYEQEVSPTYFDLPLEQAIDKCTATVDSISPQPKSAHL